MSTERPIPFPEVHLRHPRAGNILARRFLVWLFNKTIIAPADVHFINNADKRASSLIRGGCKLGIVSLHFSEREGLELGMRPPEYIPELFYLPITIPISAHHYFFNEFKIRFLTWLTAATAAPVVNDDSMEDKNRMRIEEKLGRKIHEGEGLKQYARTIKATYEAGGVVGLAPQGGRRKSLELSQAEQKPAKLLRDLKKPQDNLAFLFISMAPSKNIDYETIYDRFNFGMRYRSVFATLTLSELNGLLAKMNAVLAQTPVEKGKNAVNFDELILIILSLPIGSAYSKINRGYADLLCKIDDTGTMTSMAAARGLFPPEMLE